MVGNGLLLAIPSLENFLINVMCFIINAKFFVVFQTLLPVSLYVEQHLHFIAFGVGITSTTFLFVITRRNNSIANSFTNINKSKVKCQMINY